MQILRLYPRPTASETVGWGPAICGVTSPLGDADVPEPESHCSNVSKQLRLIGLGFSWGFLLY